MNLDSLSFALYNISYSVANLTKKNFKSSVQEISRLVAFHGLEAERNLFRCLFSHVDFSGDGKSSGKDFHQTQYLIQECATLPNKPHFVSTLCYAIDYPLQHQKSLKPSSNLLGQLSKVLKFSSFQEISFALALFHSSSEGLKQHSLNFLKDKLPKFLKTFCDSFTDTEQDNNPLADYSVVAIQFLQVQVQSNYQDFEITEELRDLFFNFLQKVEITGTISLNENLADKESSLKPEDITQIMESNLGNPLPTNQVDDSIVDRIRDVGYAFTSSLDDCRNNAAQLGFREPTPAIVARILSMMARTHTGMSDPISAQSMNSNVILWNDSKEKTDGNQPQSWNIEVFVQVIHEMAPNLSWEETVHELDHPNFLLSDRSGLKLLWQALVMGLGHEPFPMNLIYRRWRNPEGQFSFFQQVITNPDVLCLTDYNHRPVTIDALKAPPEEDNRSVANWKSLDLIETLLDLSETPFFKDEIFKFPVQQCPDLLVLGLIQTTRAMNQFHKDLLSRLISIFLNNHPNSAIVLHLAWHSQVHTASIKNIIMHSMAEWYGRGEYDQTRLSRILDVAQDLKALSMLLNVTPFMFVIDLACLASRREYLKLDKWLLDKVREHGEGFVQACINFMRRRCPQVVGGNIKDESLPKSAVPHETLATICAVLQSVCQSAPPELSETITALINNFSLTWNPSRSAVVPGPVKGSRGLDAMITSAATVNLQPGSLDPLSGLSSTVSNLSLGPNIKTSLGSNSGFPVSRDLHAFTSASLGSPIKMLSVATPATPATSVNQLNQNFPNLPSNASQLQSHFSNQLGGDMSAIFPDLTHPVAKEIEDEANSYFQRIYNHPPHPTLSIDEVLDMLKRFQDSPIQREKDVFNCMIRNLLEEYRFFPVYPDKELLTTAQLFGGIIEQNLVSYLPLGIALRNVLDALKKGQGSKMFYFGITAMDRFKTKLKEYPQYCQYLTSISTFQELPHQLIEYIEYGARSQEPPTRVQGSVIPSTLAAIASHFPNLNAAAATNVPVAVTSTVATATSTSSKNAVMGKPSIANATNIDTLLGATEKDEKIVVPPEAVQDKVAFIINNLSQSNLPQKTEEFREILKEEYWPWASQYLVMKRASIEPNFHSLYSNFLDTLKQNDLAKMVIAETFRNIKVLLRSDKVIANFSDRSLLKNLGHWLGMLTLAKSTPILHIEIDIKSLLIEAYHNGLEELLYVVPFIAKVLESCAKSRVFKPPNPWTMGIMNALGELHKEQDLKLNLKFEIEVLCKTLSIDLNDLKPGTVLKDTEKMSRLDTQLSPLPKQEKVLSNIALSGMSSQKVLAAVTSQPQNQTLPLQSANLPIEENLNTGENSAVGTPPSAMVTPAPQSAPLSMPQPQFQYNDINTMNISGLSPHISINSQLTLFQAHSHLKQCVRPAVERAVQEWILPVVDRSAKIALTTCENLIKKDFALDPEESRMRMSAHNMVRYLTAGMAMITCKDPLLISITNNLKQAFLTAIRGANQQQKDMIEQAAAIVAQENVELACCFIQKSAVEKSQPEMDKRLAPEYDLRKLARSEGRRYCDGTILTYQAERIPEQIRLKVGNVTPQQMAVYEEFGRCIPGFLPDVNQSAFSKINLPVTMQNLNMDDGVQFFDKLASDLEVLARTSIPANSSSTGSLHITAIHTLIDSVHVARNTREVGSALALVQKCVEALLEVLVHISVDHEIGARFRDAHIMVLKFLADQRMYGHQWTSKQVARYIMEVREESRFNLEGTDALLRSRLVDMPSYDLHLTQLIEKGNFGAVTFTMQLIKLYLIDERQSGIMTEADLVNSIETLARIALTPRTGPDGLSQLLEMLRSTSDGGGILERSSTAGPSMMMHTGINQAREFDDPPGLCEKTEYLLREWVNMYHSPNSGRDSTKAFSLFVHQMNLQGILKTDELITRFFRISTEMCVDHSYQNLVNQTITSPTIVRTKCFHTIDAFVRLISLLVKHSGDASNTLTKLNLLNKVLGIMAGVLLQDQEVRGTDFQQLAYQRIFIMLYLELTAPDPVLETINPQIVQAFANTLYFIRPHKAPGFSFAWLELISHRVFLGRMLAVAPQPKVHSASGCPPVNSWGLYAQLLITLFKFLTPFLRNVELAQPINLLYKGTLKILLVLLHDFPEFLCDYHYHFCDVIPPNCIQMRNLILSAFPKSLHLPDPFTPNLKVDLLADIKHQPRMVANLCSAIQPQTFKQDLDSYIKTRSPVTFLSELRSNLQSTSEPGMRYNMPLINALVLYVGTQAISYIQSKGNTPSMSTITHSSHMDIFQNLAVDLDTEGRYLFFNAMANQLRYPNCHTHYFSCTLLYLFAEANTEAIQEQITRVLLERLISNRPHPWGLLITFIELIKNQTFKFWNHEFVRCAPEIEKIFEQVARSCMHPKPAVDPSNA